MAQTVERDPEKALDLPGLGGRDLADPDHSLHDVGDVHVAANHTNGQLADGQDLTSALIGGYQLAFVAGAVTIAAGILLAFALLRPRNPRTELQLAEAPAARVPAQLGMEQQAA